MTIPATQATPTPSQVAESRRLASTTVDDTRRHLGGRSSGLLSDDGGGGGDRGGGGSGGSSGGNTSGRGGSTSGRGSEAVECKKIPDIRVGNVAASASADLVDLVHASPASSQAAGGTASLFPRLPAAVGTTRVSPEASSPLAAAAAAGAGSRAASTTSEAKTVGAASSSARGEEGEVENVEEVGMCDICGDGASDGDDRIVYCDGCNVAVHQECYGIRRIPSGYWFCAACRAAAPVRVCVRE